MVDLLMKNGKVERQFERNGAERSEVENSLPFRTSRLRCAALEVTCYDLLSNQKATQ
jgi:hypothetical protein